MSALRVALVFLLAAAAVHVGITRPATRALLAATEEQDRLRQAQAAQSAQLARVERRERDSDEALRTLTAASAASLPELRGRVLARLSGLPVENVQLTLTAGRPPAPAEIRLQAEGALDDLVALTSRLAGAQSGLALKSVALERADRDARVKLTLTANSVGTHP